MNPTPKARALVRVRANLRCEACIRYLGEDDVPPHHRRPRQMGGSKRADTNSPANLLLLCLPCHAWVESNRTEAYDLGLLIHQSANPTEVPVLLFRPGWVYLDDLGNYLPAERGAA